MVRGLIYSRVCSFISAGAGEMPVLADFFVTLRVFLRLYSGATKKMTGRKQVEVNSELNSDSDEELVVAALKGDKECFGVLVERYWSMAVAMAFGKTMDRVEAEDIAQESFIQAYLKLNKLRDRSRFAGWLSRIVARKSINHIRKQVREKTVPLADSHEEELSISVPAPSNPGLADEQQRFVRKAVMRLPEKLRKVILMRFMGDLSTREIARQLGQRPGTVRGRFHRAYQKLRGELMPLSEEVSEL